MVYGTGARDVRGSITMVSAAGTRSGVDRHVLDLLPIGTSRLVGMGMRFMKKKWEALGFSTSDSRLS